MKVSLNTQIFAGALLGVAFGLVMGHWHPALVNPPLFSAFDVAGKIFIGLLKIIMIPLVFTSIAAGIANLRNTSYSRRIWPALLLYSMTTTAMAAGTGLIIMNFVKPGVGLHLENFKENLSSASIRSFTVGDLGRRLMKEIFVHPSSVLHGNNILAVVIFAALLGICLVMFGEKTRELFKAINAGFAVTLAIVRWIMKLAPIGIMALLAKLVAQAHGQLLYVLGKYIFVVAAATLFHGTVTLPLILWALARISPVRFWLAMRSAFVTAFSTSSSTATLPVSLQCITENLNIDASVAKFVLPVGATLNMDGTAMYEAMAALFVANLCGVNLALSSQVVVVLTAMLASIGAPGIPSAGMVTMIMVLQSVGLPAGAVGILIAIDRPLDTIRTVVNVEGDCVGACVVQKAVKH